MIPPRPGVIQRVVSLVPSATETLRAWGVEPVATTRFCPPGAATTVGGTKDPDVGAIVDLAPDLVVVCEEENRREDHDALVGSGVDVHVVHIDAVADVAGELDALATRLEVTVPEHLRARPAPAPDPPERLRAFVPIWRRPWMTLSTDTYGASLLASVGVVAVPEGRPPPDGPRYPELELAAVAAERPDVVLAPSEPYPFSERHVAELEAVAPVVLVDGEDLFWWGVRTPAARERLGSAIGVDAA